MIATRPSAMITFFASSCAFTASNSAASRPSASSRARKRPIVVASGVTASISSRQNLRNKRSRASCSASRWSESPYQIPSSNARSSVCTG